MAKFPAPAEGIVLTHFIAGLFPATWARPEPGEGVSRRRSGGLR